MSKHVVITSFLLGSLALVATTVAQTADSAVTPDRTIGLWNGKDLSNWVADVPKRDADPSLPASFVVRGGMLVSLGKPEGHLITKQAYRDYRLVAEYRFPGAGGNCGILIHASTPRALYKMFPKSIEVQMQSGNAGDFWCIQEDIAVPDMETRRPRKPTEKWGGAEGDARRILNLSDGSEKPLGEWNTMVVEARGDTVTVWVNGTLVNRGHGATASQGRIAVQAEGTEVEFRRIEIGPAAAAPAADPPILEYSSSGSGPAAAEFNRLMPHRAVQALLLDIARAPRDRAYVDAALRGTDVTAERLAAIGLIRQADSAYRLAFSLLTAEDRAVIRTAAEREGRLLAGYVLAHRQAIESLITEAKLPARDVKAAAFFLVGCVSLDWDGLNLVEDRKYLARGGEGEFIPSAWQPVPPEDVRRLYWGSHNYHDSLAVTTFGDHAAVPRVGLPDLFWGMKLAAPDPVQARARRAVEGLVRREATRVMLALRDGPKNLAGLAAAVGSEQELLKDMLALLASLDYVAESAGRYEARITVLDERDRGMVRQVRQLGRKAMERWADERYAALASELEALTPRKYGVPLSRSFYWVWHYIFGIANRELVAAGLFADPYDPGRRFQGFLPSVYKLNVVQGRF